MDNNTRALRATSVLVRFARDTGLQVDPSQPQAGDTMHTALVDLLTDLRHAADAHDLDLFKALDTSYDHYVAEKQDEREIPL